ncbi:unnamed protein product [Dibothriocephalus latus]|uniref:Uncharacterized protein n=1 Tax=Dibothriocephalus latus TaxID=60516 RepID=A0A3P7PNT8_DIBLA|nr:unnamed protein product [Dibothriocephalus latus]
MPINFADFNLHVKRIQSNAEATKEFLALDNLTDTQTLEYKLTEDLAATVPKLNRYGNMTPSVDRTAPQPVQRDPLW